MEAIHIQKFIHMSPRKIRLVADMIRSMRPESALNILSFTRKNASDEVSKAIKTAVANSKQKGMDQDSLVFKLLEVNESTRMRRFKAGTRGRAKPFKKRMSHIKIVLTDDSKLKSQNAKLNPPAGGQNLKLEKIVEPKVKKGESSSL
jgi:large subunit ribosomal protein L22